MEWSYNIGYTLPEKVGFTEYTKQNKETRPRRYATDNTTPPNEYYSEGLTNKG